MAIKISTFEVTGNGIFPIDMLRYDSAWPSTGEDAANISGSGRRTIRLRTIADQVTSARWDSFNWQVTRRD